MEIRILPLLLYISNSWLDILSHFFQVPSGSALAAAIVSTDKLSNTLRESNPNHIFHQMWCWFTERIVLFHVIADVNTNTQQFTKPFTIFQNFS